MNRKALIFLPLVFFWGCEDQTLLTPGDGEMMEVSQAKVSPALKRASGGPYQVGFTTFMIYDETRGDRPIPVYVWYPADPTGIDESSPEAQYPLDPFQAGAPHAPSSAFEAHGLERAYHEPQPAQGPFPLVMHAPGWGGTAYTDGIFVGTGLAKHGFVVVATTHWGDQSTLNFDEPYDHLALAIFNRPRDVSFALDAILERNVARDDPFFGSIDPGMIVASGWSIGGYTAMVLAGGDDEVCDLADLWPGWPLPQETCAPSYPDPRISMIIPLDGSNQLLHFQEMARVNVPALGMGEEWAMAGDWQARQHAAFTGHPSYRVDIFNTDHFSFSSFCIGIEVMEEYALLPPGGIDFLRSFCAPGFLDGAEARRLIVKYMLAFLTHDRSILTPGHAITSEPNVEFFVTEKRSPTSIDEEWPSWFTYHIHQPGKAHAKAFKDLVATAEADPMGARPLGFAFRLAGR